MKIMYFCPVTHRQTHAVTIVLNLMSAVNIIICVNHILPFYVLSFGHS